MNYKIMIVEDDAVIAQEIAVNLEGFEDQDSFHIMKKVGMSDEGVRSTIRRQILLVFYGVSYLITARTYYFNKGQAAKIFDRLRSEKELIVLKNNQPSAIILSPEEYTRLTEIEEDYFLLLEANRRTEANGDNQTIPMDSVMDHLGISEEELIDAEDVDISNDMEY